MFETVNLERVEMFREKAALAMYRAILEDEVRELKRERDRLSEKIRMEDAVERAEGLDGDVAGIVKVDLESVPPAGPLLPM